MKIELRQFDKMDWMVFPGAEGDALIAYQNIYIDGVEDAAAVIVDNNGMGIYMLDGHTYTYETDYRTAKFMVEEGLNWENITTEGLEALGFYVA